MSAERDRYAENRPRPVFSIDPLVDPRWSGLLQRYSNASVFHSPAWLRALQRTYGYEPIAFTTSEPTGELTNALVFCVVRSWLTGSRLVSLPFSDHCEPLVRGPEELSALSVFVQGIRKQHGWKYVEMRSTSFEFQPEDDQHRTTNAYCLHLLDLRPDLDSLRHSFHKDSVQRKIRRAEREGLTYEEGRSAALLQKLYSLLVLTRRRHQLPPQPLDWFRNLVGCLGEAACIRIASKDGRPVAGMLTLTHGKSMVYKYGGSDAPSNNLGGMAMLFWTAIQQAKCAGAEEFDFGRSNCDNEGLITFKEHWAAKRYALRYRRWPAAAKADLSDGWKIRVANRVCAGLPDGVVTLAGKVLYRHIG